MEIGRTSAVYAGAGLSNLLSNSRQPRERILNAPSTRKSSLKWQVEFSKPSAQVPEGCSLPLTAGVVWAPPGGQRPSLSGKFVQTAGFLTWAGRSHCRCPHRTQGLPVGMQAAGLKSAQKKLLRRCSCLSRFHLERQVYCFC